MTEGQKPKFLVDGATDLLQRVAGTFVPFGYEVWSDGVYYCNGKEVAAVPTPMLPLPLDRYTNRKRISQRAFWISGRGTTLDTKEPLVRMSYFTLNGEEAFVWLHREQITNDKKLAELGGHGLPFDANNARDAVRYLQIQEALNAHVIEHHDVGNRSGQYVVDGKIGWLLGRTWIGPGHLDADPRGGHKFMSAYSPRGDYESWLTKWKEIRESSWTARFIVSSSFASPLCHLIGHRNFILHHWGDTGKGKTSGAQFGLSIWGHPGQLMATMNTTVIALTEIFRHTDSFQVLYDEDTMRDQNKIPTSAVIYSVCQGTGRDRGAKDGGVRQDKVTWAVIARTTSEHALVPDDDIGGQFNRVFQICSPNFPNNDTLAKSIYGFVEQHHGVAGPVYLQCLAELVNTPGGVKALRQMYEELVESLTNRTGAYTNHTGFAAIIALGDILSNVWLLGVSREAATERALDDATLALQEAKPQIRLAYAERALSCLKDHFVANPMEYVNDVDASTKGMKNFHITGIRTPHGMIYTPHAANAILKRHGYEPSRVWLDFSKLEWLFEQNVGDQHMKVTLAAGVSVDHVTYYIKDEVFFNRTNRKPVMQLINGGVHSNKVSGLES